MKTMLIVSVLTLLLVGTSSAGEITVTQPNNQSKWLIGSEQVIRWEGTGLTSKTTITLWRGNINIGVIANHVVPPPPQYTTDSMSYHWKVGDLLGGKALPGNNYRIGIQVEGARICFKSAPYFEIKELVLKKFPKTKFWDLYIDRMIFHAHRPPGPYTWSENHPQNNVIYVDGTAIPSDIHHECWVSVDTIIKMKTPPKSQITKADVSKWGSGGPKNFCEVKVNIENSGPEKFGGTKIFPVSMPKFTWADVQTWPEEGKVFERDLNPPLQWKPNEAYVAPYLGKKKFRVGVWIDHKNKISEIDEKNNNNPGPPYIVFSTAQEGPWLELRYTPPSKRMIGSTMTIKWRARNVTRMEILLRKDDNKIIGVIADNIVPPPPGPKIHEMSYDWKVGYLLGGKVAKPGEKYWIMIRTKGSGEINQTTQRDWLRLYVKFHFKKEGN